MKIDLTPLFQALITLMCALVTYKLVPWLKAKATGQQMENLNTMAKIAVYAAEQLIAHGDNRRKVRYAMNLLNDAGFTADTDVLRAAIEKAVHEMNHSIEYLDNHPPEEEEEAEE